MIKHSTEMLTAVWTGSQDPHLEEPKELYWSSGRAATLTDYRRHEQDTHVTFDELPVRTVKHMLPGIRAEVRFDDVKGTWVLRCAGYATIRLKLTDPQASDNEIQVEIHPLPTVFKVRVIRG